MVCKRPPRLRLQRLLRGILLMALPPLLFKEGNPFSRVLSPCFESGNTPSRPGLDSVAALRLSTCATAKVIEQRAQQAVGIVDVHPVPGRQYINRDPRVLCPDSCGSLSINRRVRIRAIADHEVDARRAGRMLHDRPEIT